MRNKLRRTNELFMQIHAIVDDGTANQRVKSEEKNRSRFRL